MGEVVLWVYEGIREELKKGGVGRKGMGRVRVWVSEEKMIVEGKKSRFCLYEVGRNEESVIGIRWIRGGI